MICCACEGRGYLPPTPAPRGVTVAGMRDALDAGRVSLCGCPDGQVWLGMLYNSYGFLIDRHGREVGDAGFEQQRGVQAGMLHRADAIAWLKRFSGVSQATASSAMRRDHANTQAGVEVQLDRPTT